MGEREPGVVVGEVDREAVGGGRPGEPEETDRLGWVTQFCSLSITRNTVAFL